MRLAFCIAHNIRSCELYTLASSRAALEYDHRFIASHLAAALPSDSGSGSDSSFAGSDSGALVLTLLAVLTPNLSLRNLDNSTKAKISTLVLFVVLQSAYTSA